MSDQFELAQWQHDNALPPYLEAEDEDELDDDEFEDDRDFESTDDEDED